jgi:RNA polymerase sigma factor (sigma-70 family)
MVETQLMSVVRHLRGLTAGPALAATDDELLEGYCVRRDEAAFVELMCRHGAMVVGVGQRLLGGEEAEDVFQATFLLLARNAATIRKRASVAAWLHSVAHHLALKARASAARRRSHERRAGQMLKPATSEAAWRELQEVLDQALHALPEHQRAVLLLCYLEGTTQEEAARRLGCPLGTVRSRLARARHALKRLLARRGLVLSAAALVTAVVAQGARATLPAPLLAKTVAAAARFALGAGAAGLISPRAAGLVAVGLKTMFTSKAKLVVVLLLAIGLAAGVAGALAHEVPDTEQMEPPQAANEVAQRAEPPAPLTPRVDCFGDLLPTGAVARLGTLRLYHGLDVRRVVLSPDGKLVSGTDDAGLNRLWDAVTGRELELKGTLKTAFILTAKGRLLAAEPERGGYRLTDLASGKEVDAAGFEVNTARTEASTVIPSPDGRLLIVLEDKGLKVLDASTRNVLPPLEDVPQQRGFSATFSPDSKVLAVPYFSPDPVVRLWDLSTRKVLRNLKGKDYQIFHTAFSADGRLVAAADGSGVTIWDTTTGKWVHDFGHTYFIGSLAFTPDGKTLVSGAGYTDGVIRTWDPLTGKERVHWRAHEYGVHDLIVTVDGKFVADNTLRIWQLATGKEVRRLGDGKQGAAAIDLSPDGKVFALSARQAIRLWDMATGEELRSFGGPSATRLQFSPDGKTLATVASRERCVRLWDVQGGKELHTLDGHEAPNPRVAFSPDGRFVATGDSGGTIRLWHPATGKELRRIDGPRKPGPRSAYTIGAIAFAPDGRSLAAGYSDQVVRLWEVATGRERAVFSGGHRAGIVALAFSPNGKLVVSGSWDRTGVVWDLTGRLTESRRVRIDARLGDQLWADLASADATKAYVAVRTLLVAEGVEAFLKARIRPNAPPDARRLARLLADLDSDDFDARETAAREIAALGEGAEPALQTVLACEVSAEMRRRVTEMLRSLNPVQSSEAARRIRAVEVLEHVGTPEATQLLGELAKGAPGMRLTEEAKAALNRQTRSAQPRSRGQDLSKSLGIMPVDNRT